MDHPPKPKENNQEKTFTNWTKGPIENEGGEFRRVLETFYDRDKLEEQKDRFYSFIKESYASSELVELEDAIWSKLENTDAHDIGSGDFQKIEELVDDRRDWQLIKNNFTDNKEVEVPIIAYLPNGTYHLVSGNTRLCVARALNIKPKVILIEFPNFS